MSKAFHHSKAQSTQTIYVTNLQLAPSMTIELSVQTLQLSKMSQWMINRMKLKQYVTIKFNGKTIHKLNCDGLVIKGLQFQTSVRVKNIVFIESTTMEKVTTCNTSIYRNCISTARKFISSISIHKRYYSSTHKFTSNISIHLEPIFHQLANS
jgi:hypothetical protein